LCTKDKSYELKYLETTNSFLLLKDAAQEENKKEIKLMVNHTLECTDYNPKKFSIINILKSECSLNYNRFTGEDNCNSFLSKYSIENLFAMSELCSSEFYNMIIEYGIFEKNGLACVFEDSFLFSVIFDILSKISNNEIPHVNVSIQEIFEKIRNEGNEKILDVLSIEEKQVIMRSVFDPVISDEDMIENHYTLNVDKVKLYCAKNVFYETKESYFKLVEFITLLKKMLILTLPSELYDKLTLDNLEFIESGAEDNIFEYLKEFDLRFLRGYCVVYFLKTQRDPLIK